MTEPGDKLLLPEGVKDILPPSAEAQHAVLNTITACFSDFGYARVKPPFVEFEDTLLSGVGAARAAQTFRIMDPISHRMMGVRADVTTQVARIASTRLVRKARPLRLTYAEPVLRVSGRQIRPERQFTQAGLELIGSDDLAADAEIIVLTLKAVLAAGVPDVTLDVTVPKLAQTVLEGEDLSEELTAALEHRDSAEIERLGGSAATALVGLIDASGTLERAREGAKALSLPPAAQADVDRLFAVVDLVMDADLPVSITVDFLEARGFQYHDRMGFSVFSKATPRDLGRGGRYAINQGGEETEPAVGATVFIDALMEVVPSADPTKRVLVPMDLAWPQRDALVAEGYAVVAQLSGAKTTAEAAKEQACSHYWDGTTVQSV